MPMIEPDGKTAQEKQEDIRFMRSSVRQIHGDGAKAAKAAYEGYRDGKIQSDRIADMIIDGAAGHNIFGGSHKFDSQREAQYLNSDQFYECPVNQQYLIVASLIDGVPLDTLSEMGLTEPQNADKITAVNLNDVVLLSGAVNSQVMTVDEAKEILAGVPELPNNRGEQKAMNEADPSHIEYSYNARQYVENAVMSKTAEVIGTEIPEEPSFEKPDITRRLLMDIGKGNYSVPNAEEFKRLATVDGAYKKEVEATVAENEFNSYRETTDFEYQLKHLKEMSKGEIGEERTNCKKVYQAYKNGTIKNGRTAEDILSAVKHDETENSMDSEHKNAYFRGQEDVDYLTGKDFGTLPAGQQSRIVELMYRGISLDQIQKIGLLENNKDAEQFREFDQFSTRYVDDNGVSYNYNEVNMIAGAIKCGVPLDEIKQVMDNLPYSSSRKEHEAEDLGIENKIPSDYVGNELGQKLLTSLGYDNFKDSPLKSLETAKHVLEDVGAGRMQAGQIKIYCSKDNMKTRINESGNKAKDMNEKIKQQRKEKGIEKPAKADHVMA